VRTDVSEERELPVTTNAVPSSLIGFTLIMKTIRSSETSVLIRTTWYHFSEDGILHRHRRENLKSYIAQICLDHSDDLCLVIRTVFLVFSEKTDS
jgi:hypothetical protein